MSKLTLSSLLIAIAAFFHAAFFRAAFSISAAGADAGNGTPSPSSSPSSEATTKSSTTWLNNIDDHSVAPSASNSPTPTQSFSGHGLKVADPSLAVGPDHGGIRVFEVDHSAWDIKKMAEIFKRHPKAVAMSYIKDTATQPGKIQLADKNNKITEMTFPAGSSPAQSLVEAHYPQAYSRNSLEKYVANLAYGDSNAFVKEPHKTIGINIHDGKIWYVIEFTGKKYADKTADEKVKIFESVKQ